MDLGALSTIWSFTDMGGDPVLENACRTDNNRTGDLHQSIYEQSRPADPHISVGTPARLPLSTSAFFTHSFSQRMRRAPDLLGDGNHCSPARRMFSLVIQHHPHCPFANLGCKFVRSVAHIGSISQKLELPANPGGSILSRSHSGKELLSPS